MMTLSFVDEMAVLRLLCGCSRQTDHDLIRGLLGRLAQRKAVRDEIEERRS